MMHNQMVDQSSGLIAAEQPSSENEEEFLKQVLSPYTVFSGIFPK